MGDDVAVIISRPGRDPMLACWPPRECSRCHRAAAYTIVRMTYLGGGHYANRLVCLDCDDPEPDSIDAAC